MEIKKVFILLIFTFSSLWAFSHSTKVQESEKNSLSENFSSQGIFSLQEKFSLSQENLFQKNTQNVEIITSLKSFLKKNPDVQKIKNDFFSLKIYKKQYDYQWLPSLQLDFPQDAIFSRGDKYSIMNQNSSPKHIVMLNPGIKFSIQQKLPGNGNFFISSGYELYYIPQRKSFLQMPFLSTSFYQSLSADSFMFGKNSESQLLKTQVEYNIIELKKNLFLQLENFIKLLSEYDILLAEIDFYNAQADFYSAKEKSAQEKNKNGLQSNLELFYTQHSLQQSLQNLRKAEFNKIKLSQQLFQLYGISDFSIFEENKNYLSDYFNSLNLNFISDEKLYENVILQNDLLYRKNELSFKPQIYFSAQVNPDTSFYYQYSDWNKSWRELSHSPIPINVNTSLGVLINLELPKAKKMRKEIYELEQNNVREQMNTIIELEEKSFESVLFEDKHLTEYFYSLENEFISENSFRKLRKEMLEKQIITLEDFFESETTYFSIKQEYTETFWKIIKNKLRGIQTSSAFDEFINTFFSLEEIL